MRWIPFFILLYLATALQAAHLGQFSAAGYFHIEYLPLLAIFYAMFAATDSAPLACFWCGLVYDLTSSGPLGLQAILLAMIGLGIIPIRKHIFRANPVSQAVLTCLGVLLFMIARSLVEWLVFPTAGGAWGGIGLATQVGLIASSTLYTALVAPGLFRLLFLLGSLLGFETRLRRV